jgi:hypothetical protein
MPFAKSAALVSVCAVAAASGAINVVPTFDPCGPGMTENPNVDGYAIVNFDPNTFESTAAMLLMGLKRNTSYGVKVDSNGSGSAVGQAFTAQTFLGIGIYATVIPGDATFGTVIDVFRWDGLGGFDLSEVTPTEERARGFGSNVN